MTLPLYPTRSTLIAVCLLMFLLGGHGLAQCLTVVGPTVPLYWDASSEADIDHYNVYRAPGSGSGYAVVGTTPQSPDPVSFTDTPPLSNGFYVVTAVNTSGLESGFSNELCVQLSQGTSNDAPIAADGSASTAEDVALTINVLSNDEDPDGDTLTVDSLTQPTNGSVVISANETVTYTPASNFNGSDSFSYTVSDGQGATDTATVTVAISAVEDAPIAVDDSAKTNPDVAVIIDVLSNDEDPDGDKLTVNSLTQPTNGSVVMIANEMLNYMPANNFNGSDSFNYTVSDGQGGTDTATVTVTVTGDTVLIANFVNGNDEALNSRVYLWNPTASAGAVTVRAFTLPLAGGTTLELTDTPLNLGLLEAESALNVKVAEDILTPLGTPMPYTEDGGNLILEFTIQAPNVRGAAQVFSQDLAFGTYTLQ